MTSAVQGRWGSASPTAPRTPTSRRETSMTVVAGDEHGGHARRARRGGVLGRRQRAADGERRGATRAGRRWSAARSRAGSGGSRRSSRLCSGRDDLRSRRRSRPSSTPSGQPLDLHPLVRRRRHRARCATSSTTAGYLHVRRCSRPTRSSATAPRSSACRAATTPGDRSRGGRSTPTGDEVVTRINYLGRFSRCCRSFSHDPRLAALRPARRRRTCRVCDDRLDGPMVFIKNANVVKGNGDLGWHVDDGIGGHPVMCPLIQAGIQLDHANADNGQLLVLAGSHRYTKHWIALGRRRRPARRRARDRARRPHGALRRHDAHHAAPDSPTTPAGARSTTSSPSRRPSSGSLRAATTTTRCSAPTTPAASPPAPPAGRADEPRRAEQRRRSARRDPRAGARAAWRRRRQSGNPRRAERRQRLPQGDPRAGARAAWRRRRREREAKASGATATVRTGDPRAGARAAWRRRRQERGIGWPGPASIRRPRAFQARALPTELPGRVGAGTARSPRS